MYLMEGFLSLGISVAASFLYESSQNKIFRFIRAIKFHINLKKYTSSFINSCNLAGILEILDQPLFCEAINSKQMKRYVNKLKKCKDLNDLKSIITQMSYCCYHFLEDSVENSSVVFNKIEIVLSKYIYGFIKQYSSLFSDGALSIFAQLSLFETKVQEEFEGINAKLDAITPNFLNATGNAEFYSKQFLQPMFYEYKCIYDNHVATRHDCYIAPEYKFLHTSDSNCPDIFVLIEYIFCGQFSNQISDAYPPTDNEIEFMKRLRQENDNFILITGAPGMGKTSLFYKFAYEKATTNYCENYKFIGLKMRDLAAGGLISPQFPLTPILKHLKCDLVTLENSILFLDGLDELLSLKDIADHRNEFIKNLFAYIKQIKNCKLIITTRPSVDIDTSAHKILEVELLPLSAKRQVVFCENYVHIHPNAKSYTEKLLAKNLAPLKIPMALYICVALRIELLNERNTLGDIFEQLFLQIEERNYDGSLTYLGNVIEPRFIAQEIAFAMATEGCDILENEKTLQVLENYYAHTNNTELFKLARNVYGLTFYYVNHSCATEFLHKSFAEFLTAEKLEKEAHLLLRSDSANSKIFENWYKLFSCFELSKTVLQFYSYKIEKEESPDILKSVENFINASLSNDWLTKISEFNSQKAFVYIKNMLNLRKFYLRCFARAMIVLDLEHLVHCLSICNAQGSLANHLSFVQMSFDMDISYISINHSIFQECHFTNVTFTKVSLNHSIFQECRFTNVTFAEVSFSRASFNNCKFFNCKFIECDLYYADLSDCEFQEAKFGMCCLKSTTMRSSSFRLCEFRDSILECASFFRLSNCTFCNVDVTSAHFSGVDLRTSTLHNLHMQGVIGPGLKEKYCLAEEVFAHSFILLSQIKYIYQFIDSIDNVYVFDDEQPSKKVEPVIAECEFCYCCGLPISKEKLEFVADTYHWPKGIQIEKDFLPRWPYSHS